MATAAVAASGSSKLTERIRDRRAWLLGLAAARAALGVIAIPLAPVLYRDHFIALVLLRPTKEVLLLAGFLVDKGDVHPLAVLAAVLPFAVFGVWHFYFLGRAYCREIGDADLPGVAGRLLPPERINALADRLAERGAWIILLGRLTIFPSTLLAAAAGSSEMPARKFFPADGAGALLSVAEAFGAGLLLGEAYESAGPWLTGAGFAGMAALVVLAGRQLRPT